MEKFKKALNTKIISITVSISLLFTATIFACPISKDYLRVPVGQNITLERMAHSQTILTEKAFINKIITGLFDMTMISPDSDRVSEIGGRWEYIAKIVKAQPQLFLSNLDYIKKRLNIRVQSQIKTFDRSTFSSEIEHYLSELKDIADNAVSPSTAQYVQERYVSDDSNSDKSRRYYAKLSIVPLLMLGLGFNSVPFSDIIARTEEVNEAFVVYKEEKSKVGFETQEEDLFKKFKEAKGLGRRAELIAEEAKSNFDKTSDAFIKLIKSEGTDEESGWAGVNRAVIVLGDSQLPLELKVKLVQAIAEKGEPVIAGYILLEDVFVSKRLLADIIVRLDAQVAVRIFSNSEIFEGRRNMYTLARILESADNEHRKEAMALAEKITNDETTELSMIKLVPSERAIKWLKKISDGKVAALLTNSSAEKSAELIALLYKEDPGRIKNLIDEGLGYQVFKSAGLDSWAMDYCLDLMEKSNYKKLDKLDFRLIAFTLKEKRVSLDKIVDVVDNMEKAGGLILVKVCIEDVNIKADILTELIKKDKNKAFHIFGEIISGYSLYSFGQLELDSSAARNRIKEGVAFLRHLGVKTSAELIDGSAASLSHSSSLIFNYFGVTATLIQEMYKENSQDGEAICKLLWKIPIPSLMPPEKTVKILEGWIEKSENDYDIEMIAKVIDYFPISTEDKINILSGMKPENREKVLKYSKDLHIKLKFDPKSVLSGGPQALQHNLNITRFYGRLTDSDLSAIANEFEKLPKEEALRFIESSYDPSIVFFLLKKVSHELSQYLIDKSSMLKTWVKQKDVLRPELDISVIINGNEDPLSKTEIDNLKRTLQKVSSDSLKFVELIHVIPNERYKEAYGDNKYLEHQFKGVLASFDPGTQMLTLSQGQLSEEGMNCSIRIKSVNFIEELIFHEFWHGIQFDISKEEWDEFRRISGWITIGYYMEDYFDDSPNKTISDYNVNPLEEFDEAGVNIQLGAKDTVIKGDLYKGVWTRAREALNEGDPVIALEALFVRWVPEYSRKKFGLTPGQEELTIEEAEQTADGLFKNEIISKEKLEFIKARLEFIKKYIPKRKDKGELGYKMNFIPPQKSLLRNEL